MVFAPEALAVKSVGASGAVTDALVVAFAVLEGPLSPN